MSELQLLNPIANANGLKVREVLNKRGNVLRNEIVFNEERKGQSASDIGKELRANGLKGKELTEKVNSILAGEKDLRSVIAKFVLDKACEDGIPDAIHESKGFTTIKVLKPKVTKSDVMREQAETIDRIKSVLTPEQIKALGLK